MELYWYLPTPNYKLNELDFLVFPNQAVQCFVRSSQVPSSDAIQLDVSSRVPVTLERLEEARDKALKLPLNPEDVLGGKDHSEYQDLQSVIYFQRADLNAELVSPICRHEIKPLCFKLKRFPFHVTFRNFSLDEGPLHILIRHWNQFRQYLTDLTDEETRLGAELFRLGRRIKTLETDLKTLEEEGNGLKSSSTSFYKLGDFCHLDEIYVKPSNVRNISGAAAYDTNLEIARAKTSVKELVEQEGNRQTAKSLQMKMSQCIQKIMNCEDANIVNQNWTFKSGYNESHLFIFPIKHTLKTKLRDRLLYGETLVTEQHLMMVFPNHSEVIDGKEIRRLISAYFVSAEFYKDHFTKLRYFFDANNTRIRILNDSDFEVPFGHPHLPLLERYLKLEIPRFPPIGPQPTLNLGENTFGEIIVIYCHFLSQDTLFPMIIKGGRDPITKEYMYKEQREFRSESHRAHPSQYLCYEFANVEVTHETREQLQTFAVGCVRRIKESNRHLANYIHFATCKLQLWRVFNTDVVLEIATKEHQNYIPVNKTVRWGFRVIEGELRAPTAGEAIEATADMEYPHLLYVD